MMTHLECVDSYIFALAIGALSIDCFVGDDDNEMDNLNEFRLVIERSAIRFD